MFYHRESRAVCSVHVWSEIMLATASVLVTAALMAPVIEPRVQRASTAKMKVRFGKQSSSWDRTEMELLGGLGLADDGDDGDSSSEDGAVQSAEAQPRAAGARVPVPRSGEHLWGRWSHEGDCIELDMILPEGARARDVACEVNKQGVIRVQVSGVEPALLTGQIALPIDRTELSWLVEEQDDGRRLLCIEIPLFPADPNAMKCIESIFDQPPSINGEPCSAPGLCS